jgi:hypothetical protein
MGVRAGGVSTLAPWRWRLAATSAAVKPACAYMVLLLFAIRISVITAQSYLFFAIFAKKIWIFDEIAVTLQPKSRLVA